MGNLLSAGFLDGLRREGVAELTFGSALVIFGVLEMTEGAGCLAHFKMMVLGQMLVARSTANFHTLDLFVLVKMGLVHKLYFFLAILDFFGHELVLGLAVAVRCQAASINDIRPCLN